MVYDLDLASFVDDLRGAVPQLQNCVVLLANDDVQTVDLCVVCHFNFVGFVDYLWWTISQF